MTADGADSLHPVAEEAKANQDLSPAGSVEVISSTEPAKDSPIDGAPVAKEPASATASAKQQVSG